MIHMVAFGHTAAGTIVGVITYQYLGSGDLTTGLLAAGITGVASHYIGDSMPHGHFFKSSEFRDKILLILAVDVIVPVIFLLGTAFYTQKSYIEILYIIFGISGAQLPDVLDSLIKLGVIKSNKFFDNEMRFHHWTHWHGTGDKALMFSFGDIWQILLFVLAVLVLIKS